MQTKHDGMKKKPRNYMQLQSKFTRNFFVVKENIKYLNI